MTNDEVLLDMLNDDNSARLYMYFSQLLADAQRDQREAEFALAQAEADVLHTLFTAGAGSNTEQRKVNSDHAIETDERIREWRDVIMQHQHTITILLAKLTVLKHFMRVEE